MGTRMDPGNVIHLTPSATLAKRRRGNNRYDDTLEMLLAAQVQRDEVQDILALIALIAEVQPVTKLKKDDAKLYSNCQESWHSRGNYHRALA